MTPNSKSLQPITFDFGSPSLYNSAYIHTFYRKDRFLHFFGSAGSGKSRFACQKEIVLSFDSARKGRRTLIVRRYENTLAASVYSELKTIIYEWNLDDCFDILKSPLSIKNKFTGVEFIFRGLDDVEKLKSITGVDRVLIEEATEMGSASDLDQLDLRLRGVRNGQITLCYNPVNVNHWINKTVHETLPPNHYILKTTYKDNVRLAEYERKHGIAPTYAEILESKREGNPNYYRIYALGLWGNNPEGLIYPDYQVVSDFPGPQFYGLDFGYNDPCALIAGCVRDEAGKPKKQLYVKEILYESHLTSDTLSNRLDALGVNKRIPIYADCSRPEMIAALKSRGYWVHPSEKGKGSVKAGIDLVKTHDLLIVAGSKELIKEVSNYSWKNKNGEWLDEPVDGADHGCDAFRYGVAGKPAVFTFRSIHD